MSRPWGWSLVVGCKPPLQGRSRRLLWGAKTAVSGAPAVGQPVTLALPRSAWWVAWLWPSCRGACMCLAEACVESCGNLVLLAVWMSHTATRDAHTACTDPSGAPFRISVVKFVKGKWMARQTYLALDLGTTHGQR